MEEYPKAIAKKVDHLGLVAGCKSISLIEQVDTLLPKTRGDVKLTSMVLALLTATPKINGRIYPS